ncbi:bacterio-opsin activator domain-containing protein [Halovivax limisalsi]|uniref:bacterio-opsin activator domain-containing protein n=1 Tax=Halovivax limisalsi TaxID=1453760 RepID=UPI001FFCEFE2|nr:bacterio-opsin activator domain-containing protein [Halovivax limisalsi]
MSEWRPDPALHDVAVLVVGPATRTRGIRRILEREFGDDSVAIVSDLEEARSRASMVDCLLCAYPADELERALASLRRGTETPILAVTDDPTIDPIAAGATDVLPADAPPGIVRARVSSTMGAAARERLDRCRSLLSATSVALLTSREGTVQWASDGIDDTIGLAPEGVVETKLSALVHPADRSDFEATETALADESIGARRSISCRLRHADERYRVHRVVGVNRLEDPVVDGLVWTIESPRTGEHSAAAGSVGGLLERIGDPAFVVDDAWLLEAGNEAGLALLDVDSADGTGRSIWDRLPPSTVDTWFERLTEARERGEPVSFVVDRPSDGGALAVRAYPNGESTLIVAQERDRTESDAMRTRLERLGSLLDAVPALAAVIESDRIAIANARTFADADRETVVGHTVAEVFGADVAERILARAGSRVRRVDPITWKTPDGSIVELSVVPLDGDEAILVGRDVTETRRLLDGIGVVSDAMSDVRGTERRDDARDVILDATRRSLSVEYAVWYRRSDSHLQPVSHATDGSPIEPIPIGLDLDRVTASGDDRATALDVADPLPIDDEVTLATALAVPIRESAVIIAGDGLTAGDDRRTVAAVDHDRSMRDGESARSAPPSTPGAGVESGSSSRSLPDRGSASGSFDGSVADATARTRTTLGTLCGAVGALTLDRLDERDARESLTAGRERAETELDACEALLDRLDRIGRSIRSAPDRSSVESTVCEALAAIDEVGLAVVASSADDGVDVRATAGPASEFAAVLSSSGRSPAVDAILGAIEADEPRVVDDLADRDDASNRRQLRRYDLSSAVAVPIAGRSLSHGALGIYFASGSQPTERFVRFATVAAAAVGVAIDSIDRRAALLSGDRLELELAVPPDAEVLSRAAVTADASITVEAAASGADATTVYLTVSGADGEPVAEALRAEPTARSVRVRPSDDTNRLEVELERPTLPDAIAAFGGTLHSVEPGADARVFVSIPSDRSVRSLVEHLRAEVPGLELVARRPAGPTNRTGREDVLSALTDRQREVLRTAYAAGYFEWPREHSGEEVAERLDISQPTFARHFRAAERAVFQALFEDD